MTRIRELLTEEEPHTWTKNTESLIAMLATTIKLSDFCLSSDGTMTVVEGRDPFVELRKDVQSIPEQSRDKAMSRVEEVILGAMTKIKVRKLHLENHKVRSTSRSREPDSDEEVKLSKFSKASPLSPSDMGPERESWPALPPPGAKVALQEVIQAPGGQQDATTRKEPPGTPSPQKDHPATKGPATTPHPTPAGTPTGAHSPHKDPLALKGPEALPQPITSQVAPQAGGPPVGLKNSLVPPRTPMHPEEEGATKGVPQKGTKEGPLEPGHQVLISKWCKEGPKPQGSNLKTPQSRYQRSSSKGDAKVTQKARQ